MGSLRGGTPRRAKNGKVQRRDTQRIDEENDARIFSEIPDLAGTADLTKTAETAKIDKTVPNLKILFHAR